MTPRTDAPYPAAPRAGDAAQQPRNGARVPRKLPLDRMQPALIKQLLERFPEPAFSELQRRVFENIQHESAALAEVLAFESCDPSVAEASKPTQSPMVRFGAYIDDELVGWSCGWMERGDTFYMANSGVAPQFRRRGLYAALLETVLSHARSHGAREVRSQHSVLNNPVIIAKLGRGFHISGLSVSAQMGCLVELTHRVHAPRSELFRSRVVPLVEPGKA